jgi:hypothetical protein
LPVFAGNHAADGHILLTETTPTSPVLRIHGKFGPWFKLQTEPTPLEIEQAGSVSPGAMKVGAGGADNRFRES